MNTLYYLPGACSLAIQIVMRELNLPVSIVDKNTVSNFEQFSPTGSVPVLTVGDTVLKEGAAILLHLLDTNPNDLLPDNGPDRQKGIEAILFANATMHPAYSRLFFGANAIEDETAKQAYFEKSAEAISQLWKIVNDRIGSNDFLFGDKVSPADILLTVYSSWGQYFPVSIELGANPERMIRNVQARDSFKQSVAAEAAQSTNAA